MEFSCHSLSYFVIAVVDFGQFNIVSEPNYFMQVICRYYHVLLMDQTIFILLFNYFVIKSEMSNKSLMCIGMFLVHTPGEYNFVIAENNINVINNVLKLSVHSLIILINLFNFKLIHCFPLDRACLEFMSQRVVS